MKDFIEWCNELPLMKQVACVCVAVPVLALVLGFIWLIAQLGWFCMLIMAMICAAMWGFYYLVFYD